TFVTSGSRTVISMPLSCKLSANYFVLSLCFLLRIVWEFPSIEGERSGVLCSAMRKSLMGRGGFPPSETGSFSAHHTAARVGFCNSGIRPQENQESGAGARIIQPGNSRGAVRFSNHGV